MTTKTLIEVDHPEDFNFDRLLVGYEVWGVHSVDTVKMPFRIIDPAQAVPDVWQYRHVDFEGDATPWTDCTREDAERIAARRPNESGGYEVRALFAAPSPAAVGMCSLMNTKKSGCSI